MALILVEKDGVRLRVGERQFEVYYQYLGFSRVEPVEQPAPTEGTTTEGTAPAPAPTEGTAEGIDSTTTTEPTAQVQTLNAEPQATEQAVTHAEPTAEQRQIDEYNRQIAELESLTVTQLQDQARSVGLEGYSAMRKAELVDALTNHYNNQISALQGNVQNTTTTTATTTEPVQIVSTQEANAGIDSTSTTTTDTPETNTAEVAPQTAPATGTTTFDGGGTTTEGTTTTAGTESGAASSGATGGTNA